jgi:hypothetical protein
MVSKIELYKKRAIMNEKLLITNIESDESPLVSESENAKHNIRITKKKKKKSINIENSNNNNSKHLNSRVDNYYQGIRGVLVIVAMRMVVLVSVLLLE